MKLLVHVLVLAAIFVLGFVIGLIKPAQSINVKVSNASYSMEKEGKSFHLIRDNNTIMWISLGPESYSVWNHRKNDLILVTKFEKAFGYDITYMTRYVEDKDSGHEYAVLYKQNGEVSERICVEDIGK